METRVDALVKGWAPALWFRAPARLAHDGWLNLPLDPNDVARVHKGIQVEVRGPDEFTIGFVEEQLADLVCLDGLWPCTLRVTDAGIVSKGSRDIHADEIIQLGLGDELAVRGRDHGRRHADALCHVQRPLGSHVKAAPERRRKKMSTTGVRFSNPIA
jgi:hypothetical protein